MVMGGQHHAPAPLPPQKRPGTHFIADWVGPRASQDWCEKSRPKQDSIPRLFSPMANRYTDCAIPAHKALG
jgi:hypothetical protein